MGKIERRRRGLLGVGAFGAALIAILLLRTEETPVASAPAATATAEIPIAPAPAPDARTTGAPLPVHNAPIGVRQSYIVQASSLDLARRAVERAGGIVTGELDIIRAVGAELDSRELATLWNEPVDGLRVYDDATVTTSDTTATPPETYYPTQVGASPLHTGGVTGNGVTVAVLDTGVWQEKGPLQQSSSGRNPRVLAQYDAILARENPQAYSSPSLDKYSRDIDDRSGHGTHISSIIASSGIAASGNYQGVAPGVNLVSVRVLDSQGTGRYFDVIAGIQWAVRERLAYGIRVINLSLSATPNSHYWDDPLNQAVMSAWASGIVVVVAAGNRGPEPMTIGVPGNVPYVITVGAVTDNYEPFQPSEYRLASFSSAGPTYEGFVKPEVVAMGGHIRAYAPDDGTLAQRFPQWLDARYPDLTMSGTSQAAAVISGVVALMLDVDPSLEPDDVKCRIMKSAHPAVKAKKKLAYSVFQQGTGLVNAHEAVYSTASGCANRGLDVALDLAGLRHYGGRANRGLNVAPDHAESGHDEGNAKRNADGDYYIMEIEPEPGLQGGPENRPGNRPLRGKPMVGVAWVHDGLFWDGGPPSSRGHTWRDAYTWGGSYPWSDAYTWGGGYTWSDSHTSSSSSTPSAGGSGIEPAPQE